MFPSHNTAQQALQIYFVGLLCFYDQNPELPEMITDLPSSYPEVHIFQRSYEVQRIRERRKKDTITVQNCSASLTPVIEKQLL